MGIIVFTIATTLSMPKQALGVYIGVILEQSESGKHLCYPSRCKGTSTNADYTIGVTDRRSRTVSNIVLAVTVVITILAMWYILRKMNQAKADVLHSRRKTR